MQRTDLIDRLTSRPPHFTLLLIVFVGVSGCFPPPPRDADDPPDTACGILYSCDDNQGRRENDEVNQAAESNSDTSTSTGTGTDPIGD